MYVQLTVINVQEDLSLSVRPVSTQSHLKDLEYFFKIIIRTHKVNNLKRKFYLTKRKKLLLNFLRR